LNFECLLTFANRKLCGKFDLFIQLAINQISFQFNKQTIDNFNSNLFASFYSVPSPTSKRKKSTRIFFAFSEQLMCQTDSEQFQFWLELSCNRTSYGTAQPFAVSDDRLHLAVHADFVSVLRRLSSTTPASVSAAVLVCGSILACSSS
jgi:hypothetical protein